MKRTRKKGSMVLGAVAALLLVCGTARAQVTTGTLYGQVVDATGGAVPGAMVTAANEQTSTVKSTVSDDRGRFTLAFLTLGTYTVTVEMDGFKTRKETGLEISSGQKLNLSFTLEVGTPSDTVTVSSQAPLINAVSPEEDVNLSRVQVAELPVFRRDFTGLLNLGTGISSGGENVSINGLPPLGFTFAVDGVDAASDSERPSMAMYQNFNYIKGVSLEAVKEVEVSKNIFSAEYGQTVSGNVNIITKGGTNQFHGSGFEQYQSGGLNAINHLARRKVPEVMHQFGGSLGGPIVKDKLFFFGTYEGYRVNKRAAVTGNVPTKEVRDQVIAALPSTKPYFEMFPLPTDPYAPGAPTGFYVGSKDEKRTENHAVLKMDYNVSTNDFLSVRYTRSRPNYLQPTDGASFNYRNRTGVTENVGASFTRVWGPRLTSELRFGYNRADVNRIDRAWEKKISTIDAPNIDDVGGEQFVKTGSTSTIDNQWAWSRGRHSLKLGGMLKILYARRINEETPTYTFDTFQDLLANKPSEAQFQFLLRPFQLQDWYGGVFVQDDFRVRPDLTVNLGLRWDYSAVPNERDNRLFNRNGPYGSWRDPDSPWEASYTSFSPRVGFAWSMDKSKKTVLRGGFGVFYIPFNLFAGPVEIVANGVNEPADAELAGSQLVDLGIRYPDYNDVVLPKVKASNIIALTAIDPNWDPSYSEQWSFGIQRELTNTMAWEVSYVGNHGVKLAYSPLLNRVNPLTGTPDYPDYARFRYYQSADSSVYHSLQTSLKKRFSHSLVYNVNYTYASNLSYFLGNYDCCGTGDNPQDLNDLRSNRAPTPYHIRHRLTSDFVYELPLAGLFGRRNRLLLEGWQVGGILSAQTGGSLNISQGGTATPGARPDWVGTTHEAAIFDGYTTSRPDGTYWYLDKKSFAQAPLGKGKALARAGTFGRRSIYGPGEWTLDLSLSKNLKLAETRRIQFRTDLFNSLNHTNFRGVTTDVRSSNFGRISSTSSGRQMQLSVRFDF